MDERSRVACSALTAALVIAVAGCGGTRTATVTVTTQTSPAAAAQPSFPALVARVRTAVIRIEVTTCDGLDTGTGILVGPHLIATVDHVVAGAVSIALVRNRAVLGHGTVIGEDSARDVALIESDAPIVGYHFHFANRAPLLGETVAAIGFPLGLPLTVTNGLVSGLDRTIPIDGIDRTRLVQTDAPVNPGNSGGPLMTSSGAVVGLVDLGTEQANGLAFAVSAAVAGPLVQVWTASPQPVADATCASYGAAPAPSSTAAPTSSAALVYTGQDFSIDYPPSWVVSHLQLGGGNLDTTFSPANGTPGLLIRVDENPTAGQMSVTKAAAPVIAALEKEASYIDLGTSLENLDGRQALRWEFEDVEDGIEVHKVDIFFTDPSGHGWGVLIEAPESVWNQDAQALLSYEATLSTS